MEILSNVVFWAKLLTPKSRWGALAPELLLCLYLLRSNCSQVCTEDPDKITPSSVRGGRARECPQPWDQLPGRGCSPKALTTSETRFQLEIITSLVLSPFTSSILKFILDYVCVVCSECGVCVVCGICVVCASVHTMACMCSQRTTCGSWFSSIILVPGTRFMMVNTWSILLHSVVWALAFLGELSFSVVRLYMGLIHLFGRWFTAEENLVQSCVLLQDGGVAQFPC